MWAETKEKRIPRAQIKDEKTYRKLRDQGESKEKSARIANAAAATSRSQVGRKGGQNSSYDDWSKQDLVRRAREIGIKGRSTMSKAQLIRALRVDVTLGHRGCLLEVIVETPLLPGPR